MTVYVDEIREYPLSMVKGTARRFGGKWCHLTADDRDELHAFADKLSLKRAWFQDHATLYHYDLTPGMRERALRFGAQVETTRQTVERLWGSTSV